MGLIESFIEESPLAVLATADMNGKPHIRWITPGCIKERVCTVFMVSGSHFSKISQIHENPQAELMFQTRSLDKILNVRGKINLLDNPSIQTEVIECIGPNLGSFWKSNRAENDLVVMEFVIMEAVVYNPQKGTRITVNFTEEV
jgi:pyridoxamine 5'-phosphate oxidase